tara:strand:+ start:228 stop:920 length:693 start_codon:yes stop_codon:yes gene_type:complete
MPSPYYQPEFKQHIQEGGHRDAIGGLWDEMGRLQLEFLKAQGLQPYHRLMDIGCGPLRFGCLAVDFLDARNYYGVDISEELLDIGYNNELTDRQRERLPRSHLAATDQFDLRYLQDTKLDMAIAQSVFTHLPMNHIRHCLKRLAPHMKTGCPLFATFLHCPDHHDVTEPLTQPVSPDKELAVTSYDIRDPYHYTLEDLEYCTRDTAWRFQMIGDWGHPRGQKMAGFFYEG